MKQLVITDNWLRTYVAINGTESQIDSWPRTMNQHAKHGSEQKGCAKFIIDRGSSGDFMTFYETSILSVPDVV